MTALSYLDFVHDAMCKVTEAELQEFVRLYWLSQYGECNAYKKDNRIFAVYNVGENLEVYVVNKELLPIVNF